jgi:hypothetical protein
MKFEHLTPGAVVFELGSRKMGNTTMSTKFVSRVSVESRDETKKTVTARINGAPARVFRLAQYTKWKRDEPVLVGTFSKRLATRAERDELAARAAKAPSLAPAPHAVLMSTEHGFDDYEIKAHPHVHRITVGHGVKKGDVVNIYDHDCSKRGGRWLGDLQETLRDCLSATSVEVMSPAAA